MSFASQNDPRSRARVTIIGIIVVGVLVMIAVWGVVITSIIAAKHAAMEHAHSEAHNLAAAFGDEVSRNLDGVADAMNVIAGRMQAGEDPHKISAWAREIPLLSLATIQAGIIGRDGWLISSTLDPDAQPVDLSDREHVRVHLEGRDPGLFISKPVLGRVSGRVTLNVTRRVDDKNGNLLGIIVFSLAPGQLTNLTKNVDLGPNGVITLSGVDGVIRARFTKDHPDGLSGSGVAIAGAAPLSLSLGNDEDFYVGRSAVDQVERLYNNRRVSGYPLMVSVGLDLSEILAAPTAERTIIVLIASGVTLLLIGLAVFLSFEIRRRALQAVELADERSNLTATNLFLEDDVARREQIEQELRDAQETLKDAVESISEAFVIFDRDDRFVMCNEAYCRVYANSSAILKPGTRFEDIQRHGAYQGEYASAIGREEEWIAERLAAHRDLSGSVEQWLTDGRCLLITERQMRGGGTAGLRVDITELKGHETKLREMMESLNDVQRIAGLGSMKIDIAAEHVEWLAGACGIFGVAIADVEPTFDYLRSFIHPDDLAAVNDAAFVAHASGVAAPPLEYRIIRRDGSERVVYRENEIKYDAHGDAITRVLTYKDITELKRREAELRRAIDQLDRVQRIAGIGHTTMDLQTGLFEWSAGACAIFGIDPDTVEPSVEFFCRFVHPADREKVTPAAKQAGLDGVPAPPLEYRIIRADGAERIVYRENAVETDATGRPVGRIVTFQDITELKVAETQLRASREHLARAQRVAATGSFELDLDTREIIWSEETYRIFGLPPEIGPLNQQMLEEYLVPEDRPRVEAQIAAILEGRTDGELEYRIRRPDGCIRTLRREIELVCDSDGRRCKLLGVIRDITELRQAERRRDELERQLLHSQKLEALGTLAGGVAHDLNNTLVPILSLAKLVLEDLPGDSPLREDVEIIISASGRARDLVKQILAFSRKQEIQKAETDPAAAVRQALQMMRATLPANITMIEAIDDVPRILADAGQLQQVVVNLVTNAAQAIGTASASITVEVSTAAGALERAGDFVRIRIADTGCGMEKEVLERIFEPFYTTKEVGEGTGLGLSVVHGIIIGHGGTIDVASKLGNGTTFTIMLPVSETVNIALAAA